MYLDHFGLSALPFASTADPSFAYDAASQCDVLDALLLALDDGAGIVKVVGAAGIGKTLVCRRVAAALAMAGGGAVLLIDDAHALAPEALLSKLEIDRPRQTQIVLFGPPELDSRLALPALRLVASRISFQCGLQALSRAETEQFLAHRLRIAGYRGEPLFPPSIAAKVHRATRGVPRLINRVAHKSLLLAAAENASRITAANVKAAASRTPLAGGGLWRVAQWVEQWRARPMRSTSP